MKGKDIEYIQEKLKSLGFNCGDINGYYTQSMKEAVEEFQRVFVISVNGEINSTLWDKIINAATNNSDILVFSTFRTKGWKQPTYLTDGTESSNSLNKTRVADDMTFNDFSKEDIQKLDPHFVEADFKLSVDEHFDSFEKLVKTCSMMPLQTVALDVVNQMRNGNNNNFTNDTLTQKAKAHPTTRTYVDNVLKNIKLELSRNNGDISKLRYKWAKNLNGNVTNLTKLIGNLERPQFSSNSDLLEGLKILINDTWANNIIIKNYNLTGNKYTCEVIITIYDHFGLDYRDVSDQSKYRYNGGDYAKVQGFRSWFILQHYKGFNGKYKPFPTVIKMNYTIEGTI